jgi:hypothetical protein
MISSRSLFLALAAWTWTATNFVTVVNADPSPQVQKDITAAIKAAASGNGTVDYTKFVNPFVGTGELFHSFSDAPHLTTVLSSNRRRR